MQKHRTTFFDFLDILNIGDKPLNNTTMPYDVIKYVVTAFYFAYITIRLNYKKDWR